MTRHLSRLVLLARELPLTFHRQEAAFLLNRPQVPKGPFPYERREVTFRIEAGNHQLAGALLLPEGERHSQRRRN